MEKHRGFRRSHKNNVFEASGFGVGAPEGAMLSPQR
jgi:hypothetical protein